jgi:hypothetical protein
MPRFSSDPPNNVCDFPDQRSPVTMIAAVKPSIEVLDLPLLLIIKSSNKNKIKMKNEKMKKNLCCSLNDSFYSSPNVALSSRLPKHTVHFKFLCKQNLLARNRQKFRENNQIRSGTWLFPLAETHVSEDSSWLIPIMVCAESSISAGSVYRTNTQPSGI